MEVWYLPNEFWIAMEKGVAHTTTHAKTNNATLRFTILTHPGRIKIWEAFKEQSKIG
jgi:hypothetical protein